MINKPVISGGGGGGGSRQHGNLYGYGRRTNMNPKLAGTWNAVHAEGTFLFYDRLKRVATAKLDQDPHRDSRCATPDEAGHY